MSIDKGLLADNDTWRSHPGLAGKDLLYTKHPFGKIAVRAFGDKTMAKRIAHQSGGEHTRHASGLWHIIRDTPKKVQEQTTLSTIKRVLKAK